MSSKADRKAKALAKINAYIALCSRQADRKTGAARQVYLDAAARARKSIV